MITGKTMLIAHLGYPTAAFKAPMIYNPYFEKAGVDAVVVPMGIQSDTYPSFLRELFKVTNIRGALVTMPHKVITVGLADEVSTTAQIAGSANALLKRDDGTLLADMFDGEGFVRGVLRKGRKVEGANALVVGCGGVGSAIAASLAGAGVTRLGLFDANAASADGLADRLTKHYPELSVSTGSTDRVRRRGRDEAGHHAVPPGGAGTRLRNPGGDGHALRADPGLSRVLRLSHHYTGRAARRRAGRILSTLRQRRIALRR
jgi:shikimate dehydrogenase